MVRLVHTPAQTAPLSLDGHRVTMLRRVRHMAEPAYTKQDAMTSGFATRADAGHKKIATRSTIH